MDAVARLTPQPIGHPRHHTIKRQRFRPATGDRRRAGIGRRADGDIERHPAKKRVAHLRRCGFDAFALRADKDPYEALESLKDFSVTYQAATDEPLPLFRRR